MQNSKASGTQPEKNICSATRDDGVYVCLGSSFSILEASVN